MDHPSSIRFNRKVSGEVPRPHSPISTGRAEDRGNTPGPEIPGHEPYDLTAVSAAAPGDMNPPITCGGERQPYATGVLAGHPRGQQEANTTDDADMRCCRRGGRQWDLVNVNRPASDRNSADAPRYEEGEDHNSLGVGKDLYALDRTSRPLAQAPGRVTSHGSSRAEGKQLNVLTSGYAGGRISREEQSAPPYSLQDSRHQASYPPPMGLFKHPSPTRAPLQSTFGHTDFQETEDEYDALKPPSLSSISGDIGSSASGNWSEEERHGPGIGPGLGLVPYYTQSEENRRLAEAYYGTEDQRRSVLAGSELDDTHFESPNPSARALPSRPEPSQRPQPSRVGDGALRAVAVDISQDPSQQRGRATQPSTHHYPRYQSHVSGFPESHLRGRVGIMRDPVPELENRYGASTRENVARHTAEKPTYGVNPYPETRTYRQNVPIKLASPPHPQQPQCSQPGLSSSSNIPQQGQRQSHGTARLQPHRQEEELHRTLIPRLINLFDKLIDFFSPVLRDAIVVGLLAPRMGMPDQMPAGSSGSQFGADRPLAQAAGPGEHGNQSPGYQECLPGGEGQQRRTYVTSQTATGEAGPSTAAIPDSLQLQRVQSKGKGKQPARKSTVSGGDNQPPTTTETNITLDTLLGLERRRGPGRPTNAQRQAKRERIELIKQLHQQQLQQHAQEQEQKQEEKQQEQKQQNQQPQQQQEQGNQVPKEEEPRTQQFPSTTNDPRNTSARMRAVEPDTTKALVSGPSESSHKRGPGRCPPRSFTSVKGVGLHDNSPATASTPHPPPRPLLTARAPAGPRGETQPTAAASRPRRAPPQVQQDNQPVRRSARSSRGASVQPATGSITVSGAAARGDPKHGSADVEAREGSDHQPEPQLEIEVCSTPPGIKDSSESDPSSEAEAPQVKTGGGTPVEKTSNPSKAIIINSEGNSSGGGGKVHLTTTTGTKRKASEQGGEESAASENASKRTKAGDGVNSVSGPNRGGKGRMEARKVDKLDKEGEADEGRDDKNLVISGGKRKRESEDEGCEK